MLRRLLSRSSSNGRHGQRDRGNGHSGRQHMVCPQCRRILLVPDSPAFRCVCGQVFRLTSLSSMQVMLMASHAEHLHRPGHGLSKELVGILPEFTYSHTSDDDDLDASNVSLNSVNSASDYSCCSDTSSFHHDPSCSICLSDYEEGDSLRVLPCQHRFHKDEIDDWLDRTPRCPLCHLDVAEALTGEPSQPEKNTIVDTWTAEALQQHLANAAAQRAQTPPQPLPLPLPLRQLQSDGTPSTVSQQSQPTPQSTVTGPQPTLHTQETQTEQNMDTSPGPQQTRTEADMAGEVNAPASSSSSSAVETSPLNLPAVETSPLNLPEPSQISSRISPHLSFAAPPPQLAPLNGARGLQRIAMPA